MGKLVFGMMQSLDGYVDGVADRLEFPPPFLISHLSRVVCTATDCL